MNNARFGVTENLEILQRERRQERIVSRWGFENTLKDVAGQFFTLIYFNLKNFRLEKQQ